MSKRTTQEAFGVPKVNHVPKTPKELEYIGKCKVRARKRRRMREDILSKYSEVEALFTCPECGSKTGVEFDAVQRRSSDEALVYECTCTVCDFHFQKR